jgi:hypothetical protein
VPPLQGAVRGHGHHGEAVDRPQLATYLTGRAGHPGEAQIPPEKPLVAEARQGFMEVREGTALFGFDELVQAMFPRPIGHDAAGELVDDLDFAILDQVMRVAPHQVQGGQCLGHKRLTSSVTEPHAPKALGQVGQTLLTSGSEPYRPFTTFQDKVPLQLQMGRQCQRRFIDASLRGIVTTS